MDTTLAGGLRIYLLGRFHVVAGGNAIDDSAWRRERAASLIKMLALAPHFRLHRDQAIELLWPDSPPTAGHNALHQVLHVARRILRTADTASSDVIRLQHEVVSLASGESVWVDADAFEAEATRARLDRNPQAMQAALLLYRGDLLPDDRYQEWTLARRDALQRLQTDTLLDLARIQTEAGDHIAAIATLRGVLTADPAHEEAHVAMMRALALSGQRHAALRQYRALQEALSQEFGAVPQPATQHLHDEISRGVVPAPVAGANESPGRLTISPGQPAAMTTLPLEVNSFVGRSHAVAEVCALLGAARVLTLTGAGGVGKTRLAVHSAAVLKATEHLAIPFVDLSTLTQASLVPQTVAAAVGVAEQSGRPILETLIDRLRSERLILLLDNCEHVVDACARLVQTLVEACPQLRVVCTSREPLHILGELVWRVSSLTLPDPRRSHRVEELLEYESVRLFCDRAGAVLTGFEVTEANSRAIAQICHRLDGIPLALELAAARVTVLSPEQIVERLDDCFTLLARGSRTAMGRQQTMKALLDWSFDLLDDDERMLFRRLAVFAGSFSLAALEAIAGTDDLAAAGMLDRLHGLVDKSLVVPVDGAKAVRFRLLEPIRQYAALQLEAAGESMTFHSRHADWYTGLAEAADDALWGRGHRNAVAELERERVNIRSALGWCTAHDRTRGLRLAHAQWQFWLLRGYLAEGRRWFEQLLEGQPKPHPAGARGMLDAWALATRQGNYGATTTAKIEAGIELYRALNDRIGLTQAIHERAIQSYMRGYYDQARPHFEESQAVAIAAGFTPGCALATYGLGIISWAQGRFDEARALMETALELLRTCQPQGPVSTSFLNVGLLETPYGEFARALTVQEETWVLLRRIEVSVAIGYALANLGNIARLQGRFAEAESYLEASIARFEANGDNAGTSQALGQMGNLLRVTGRYGEARARLERSLTLRRELGDRRGAGRTLNNLGILSIDEGDAARAATFFAESMSLFAEMGDKPGMTATHENMGHLALRTGDFAAARSAYKLGLALSREMGSVNRSIACNSRHRGLAERALGDEAASRTSFLASRALFLEMGDELSVATLDHLLQSPGAPA